MKMRAACILTSLALAAAFMAAPAAAEQPSATPEDVHLSAAEADIVARAQGLVQEMRGARPGVAGRSVFEKDLRELAALGEPAQVALFEEMGRWNFANRSYVGIVTEEWDRLGLKVSARNRERAVKIFLKSGGGAGDIESLAVMELIGPVPELADRYSQIATGSLDRTRGQAVDALMKIDPTGKVAVDAIKAAMARRKEESNPRFYQALRQVGAPAVPLLIELSNRPNLETRRRAVAGMQLADGAFNQDLADRLVEMYLHPSDGLSSGDSDVNSRIAQLQRECLTSLQALGDEGRKLATNLSAGGRPVSAARERMLKQLDAPEPLKAALFPVDPTAAVSQAQFEVMKDLAAADSQEVRPAVEKAIFVLQHSSDVGTCLVTLRYLTYRADQLKPEDAQSLIVAGGNTSPTVIDQLAAVLLGGRFEYSPDLRDLCFHWLLPHSSNGLVQTDAQDAAIKSLAKYPLGRQALVDSFAEKGELYFVSSRAAQAMFATVGLPEFVGSLHGGGWGDPAFRMTVGKLALKLCADPAHVEDTAGQGLFGSDDVWSRLCATILTSPQHFDKIGPVSRERAQQLSLVPMYNFQPGGVVGVSGNSNWAVGPTFGQSVASGQTPSFKNFPFDEKSLSGVTWAATGAVLLVLVGLIGVWVLVRPVEV
jgi:hypothetical protein